MSTKKQETAHEGLNKTLVTQLAEDVVRQAIKEQARGIEKHLTDIHKRLTELEKRR